VKVCGRRPPVPAAPPSWGRHPQTFTQPEVTTSARNWYPKRKYPATTHSLQGVAGLPMMIGVLL
jgi:hypothetical protein